MVDSGKSKKRILVVDDEPDLVEIISELLQPHCDEVLTANNGLQALQLVQQHQDLCAIVSDLSMPEMTGLELLESLRRAFNPIPFVIITGFGDLASFQKAVSLGATDFLQKPYDPDEVVNVVKTAIQYGAQLVEIENQLRDHYKESKLSPERIEELKRAKRTISAMRIERKLYEK